jgi:hypothetical protein
VKPAPFLFLLLAIPALAFDPALTTENKTRPASFVGVPWGAAPEEAARILTARVGAVAPGELPASPARLALRGGTFSGETVERWELEFVNHRFATATVLFKNDATASTRYRELKQQLLAKYGAPVRDGRPPIALGAEKKDRRAQQRSNPEQKLFGNLCSWRFPATLADREAKTIDLILATPAGLLTADEGQLIVTIRYVNEAFAQAPPASGKPAPTPRPTGPDDL